VKSYTEVVTLGAAGASWRARFRDVDTGEEGELDARCVVNAAGPWAEEIRALAGASRGAGLRRTRGTHVVVPGLTRERALLLTARRDGRVFFVLPWGGHSLVGTTDVDDETPPERIAANPGDIRYLLDEAARAIPALAARGRPLRAFAGLRSLAQGKAILPWANSRELRVVAEGTMLTLIGGKYTTHRSLAERVVDQVVRVSGARAGRCVTGDTPLASRGEAIAKLKARFPGAAPVSEAEVVHAIQAERARHLGDVLERRTRLWLDSDAMRSAAGPVSRWMAPHLGWNEAARAREVDRVTRALDGEAAIIDAALEGA
jgi:glycerol-3-phosphate dehydrogenase